ncbi:hypothetical protein diail_2515 [Diaporthe ilicicola]|nr:hypothetical protein diail_2515 [Diaporthe ilicicola]
MASKSPQATDTNIEDVLDLASQAVTRMENQANRATTKVLDLYIPHDSTKQPMPLSTTKIKDAFPDYEKQQNDTAFDPSDVGANLIADQLEQCGTRGEPEVEMSHEDAPQGTKVPSKTGNSDTVAEPAEPQDGDSSDDLSDLSDEEKGDVSDLSPEPEAGAVDHLDKYAFNYSGQAYDHRVPQYLAGGTTLFARKLTQVTTIAGHLATDNIRNQHVSPSLVPHALEMKRSPKTIECVWVGMLPTPQGSLNDAASTSVRPGNQADSTSPAAQDGETSAVDAQIHDPSTGPKKLPKKVKKGIVDIEVNQLDVIAYNPNALRVVAKKSTNPAVKAWYVYALTRPDSNSELCQGWKVNFEEVFFFKAFRDDTTTGYMKRRHATHAKIKAMIFPADLAPASIPQSPASAKQSGARISLSPAQDFGSLPTPKSSAKKKDSVRVMNGPVSSRAPNAGIEPDQDGNEAAKPVDNVQNGDTFVSDNTLAARSEPTGLKIGRSNTDHPIVTGIVCEDEEEDAYPEHAISPTSRTYKDFVEDMVRKLSVVEPTEAKTGEKRKRGTSEPIEERVATFRRNTGGSSTSNEHARSGENGAEPASFVAQQDTDHLVKKLKSLVNNLARSQDIAGLRQCVTMVQCIEKRGRSGPKSALGPYLSVSSERDIDPRACCGKLREILDLFPSLENVDVDNHLLSWMIYGLNITGQSLGISLIEPFIISFSRLYKKNFRETANHQSKMEKGVLIDMICQARDDAEKMMKNAPFESDPKVWAPHFWTDPRQDVEPVEVDQMAHGGSQNL